MKRMKEYELEVHQLKEADVFKSIIRIDRQVADALGLRLHGLCEVRSRKTRRSIYVQIRSIENEQTQQRKEGGHAEKRIHMDEELRKRLGVNERESYWFAFIPIGRRHVYRKLAYLANHEDPVVRITFWLAVFSVVVGFAIAFVQTLIPSTR